MPYKESIIKAIEELNVPTGSSAIAIKKHVQANLPEDKIWMNAVFHAFLTDCVASGELIKAGGSSYKLSPEFKKKRGAAPNATETGRTSSPESSGRSIAISMKRKQELEQDSKDAKRCKAVMKSMAEDYICPVSTELPIDPVTAEDGRVYERSAIEECIERQGNDLKSPITREPMGPRLTPAVQARNSIRSLVESGIIDGELAEHWKQKVEVEETRKKANEGDAEAMYDLGYWCYNGENGLAKDYEMSYQWYKKASDLHSVLGMASSGYMLINGLGVEKNFTYGMILTSTAAGMGSDLAAHNMGIWYHFGKHGIPKDVSQAKYWYRKVVDGSCSLKHAKESTRNYAAEKLRALEGN